MPIVDVRNKMCCMQNRSLKLTRRALLRSGATVAAGVCARRMATAYAGGEPHRPAFKSTLLNQVSYRQVDLAPGPTQRQFDETREVLLNLSEDGLLRPFRFREGLPTPGDELGGWYSTDGFAPACPFGQWMSALARMYSVTRDQAAYDKIDRMIRGYAATLEPIGKFYQNYCFPGYIYDKLSIGLTDANVFANHPSALAVLARTTDIVLPYLPPKAMPHQETPIVAGEQYTRHVWDETYTMPENFFLAWQRTGDERYYDLAKRFIFAEYFDPLARGENALPGRHAYSHVNALGSAAMAYLATGDEKFLRAATNGFRFVQEQSYATGGWGPSEHFVVPGSGALGASLEKDHASFETPCGSYAHFKLARYLMRITGDSRYGDSMEQVLYNTVLGARPLEPDGRTFYYSDYTFQGAKFFHRDKWPCCSGTLPQIAADYRISAYFQNLRGVYVNLYLPSTLRWVAQGAQFALKQSTNYPYSSHIRIDVAASSPAEFSVFLRIPAWAQGATLTASGISGSRKVEAGAFAEIRREWKNGDTMELELPFATRLEAVDAQHPDMMALVNGPLVLMALRNGDAKLGPVSRATLLGVQQTGPRAHEWIAGSGESALRMKPFLDIQDEGYTAYLKVVES
jgi:uncharacterized protein